MNGVKRILCAVDLSATTPFAMRPAVSIARECGAEIVLLHVLETRGDADGQYMGAAREAAWRMEEMAARAREASLDVRARVEHGVPDEEILAVADDEGVDLITMATTHAPEGPGRVRVGDVATKVLRRARCPVLTVSPDSGIIPDVNVEQVLRWICLANTQPLQPRRARAEPEVLRSS